MRLDKALDILYGELLNEPYISAFEDITCVLSEVRSGSLFFLSNAKDAKKAIESGAYGIISEQTLEILDKEIAWIKVNDIKQSMQRMIRYCFLEIKQNIILLTPIELALAKSLQASLNSSSATFFILKGDSLGDALMYAFRLYKQLISSPSQTSNAILTTINEFCNLDIPLLYSRQYLRLHADEIKDKSTQRNLASETLEKCKLVSYSLFESKIVYKGRLHTLALPYIFLPFLESLFAVLLCWKQSNINDMENNTTQIDNDIFSFDLHAVRFEVLELCYIDMQGNFTASTKHKTLVFCKNWNLFSHNMLQEEDFAYTEEIQKDTKRILQALKVRDDSNIFMEYLMFYASHLCIFSCYPKGFLPIRTTRKNIAMPYAHLTHLCQILKKIPYNLAVVYGVSRKSFDKMQLLPKEKNKIVQKQGEQNLFTVYAHDKE